jgi:hypothetical protein
MLNATSLDIEGNTANAWSGIHSRPAKSVGGFCMAD